MVRQTAILGPVDIGWPGGPEADIVGPDPADPLHRHGPSDLSDPPIGEPEARLNAKVHDLMTSNVVTTQPHVTISHARSLMSKSRIGAVPVVDSDGAPVGIVSATDLLADLNPASPVSTVMTEKVYTVAQYDDASIAARVMRNHRIHRVVVTHEQKVVGVLSAFDLLDLVAGHRFVMKNPPTRSSRKGAKRR